MRTYYIDRYALESTGNPNGYGSALLKIAQGMTKESIELRYLHPLLESFDLTLPLDPQQALSMDFSLETNRVRDGAHLSRFSRSLFFTHPPLGERLYILGKCAEFWRVKPAFDLPVRSPFNLLRAYLDLPLLPRAIITATIGGTILRCLFWLVGFISIQYGFQPLMWMAQNSPWNSWLGWVIIAFILGIVWAIKRKFPSVFIWVILLKLGWDNLNRYNLSQYLFWLYTEDRLLLPWVLAVLPLAIITGMNKYFPRAPLEKGSLNELLKDSSDQKVTLVALKGKLLGRRGVSNWLSQDLRLQTDTGTIKLKYSTALGPLGNIFSFFPRPYHFTGEKVIVRGWLRHSVYPWIDIDTITCADGKSIKSNYRVWLVILAFASAIWSAYQIYKI